MLQAYAAGVSRVQFTDFNIADITGTGIVLGQTNRAGRYYDPHVTHSIVIGRSSASSLWARPFHEGCGVQFGGPFGHRAWVDSTALVNFHGSSGSKTCTGAALHGCDGCKAFQGGTYIHRKAGKSRGGDN